MTDPSNAAQERAWDGDEGELWAVYADLLEHVFVRYDDALLDAANKNRVAQYGEDNYVNDDVMNWAKDVLGVGDAVGKIDEVRDSIDHQ